MKAFTGSPLKTAIVGCGGIGCLFSLAWLWLAVPAWSLFGLGIVMGVAVAVRQNEHR